MRCHDNVFQLKEEENVQGVVTLNEQYETRYFVNSAQVCRSIHIESQE